MNAAQFREEVVHRVPAWGRLMPQLDALVAEDPEREILLRPSCDLEPFQVTMMLHIMGWSGDMLMVWVVVGGPPYFNRGFNINPNFLHLFRPYVGEPMEIHRSRPL